MSPSSQHANERRNRRKARLQQSELRRRSLSHGRASLSSCIIARSGAVARPWWHSHSLVRGSGLNTTAVLRLSHGRFPPNPSKSSDLRCLVRHGEGWWFGAPVSELRICAVLLYALSMVIAAKSGPVGQCVWTIPRMPTCAATIPVKETVLPVL